MFGYRNRFSQPKQILHAMCARKLNQFNNDTKGSISVRWYGSAISRLPARRCDMRIRYRSGHTCIAFNAQRRPGPVSKTQNCAGHMGEALPFWLWRLDFMGTPGARAGRGNQLKPSECFKRNFSISTSGVEDPLALRFCIDKLGIDSVMWAIDYPCQPTAPAVAFTDSAPLIEGEHAKVAHG